MSDNNKELVEIRTLSMYSLHWSILEAFAKDMGYSGISAANRRIIEEWAELKRQVFVDSPTPYNAEGEPAI